MSFPVSVEVDKAEGDTKLSAFYGGRNGEASKQLKNRANNRLEFHFQRSELLEGGGKYHLEHRPLRSDKQALPLARGESERRVVTIEDEVPGRDYVVLGQVEYQVAAGVRPDAQARPPGRRPLCGGPLHQASR